MSARVVHRLTLRSPGSELAVELIGVDPPELDVETDHLTLWGGVGSELRILRAGQVVFSNEGNPVPQVPAGMSVRMFLRTMGLKT